MLQHFRRAFSAGRGSTENFASSFGRSTASVRSARTFAPSQRKKQTLQYKRSWPRMASSTPTPPSNETDKEGVKTEAAGQSKLVVFGGNGFVGSRVCEAGINMGLKVVSVNRSGRPDWLTSSWGDEVEWVLGDALEPSSYTEVLRGATGAVSCVGGFGSNEVMYRVCGEANIRAIETAAAVGVGRFAFISVHEYNLPGTANVGYFKGKKDAEETLEKYFGTNGVALRPSLIHGTRYVNKTGIPLGAVFGPLEKVLGFLPNKQLSGIPILGAGFVPPVSVDAVGKAAATAAVDESVVGPLDVWKIAEYS